MTETEWLSCEDPEAMLAFLRKASKLTRRKGRLFGVAVCHRIGHLLTDGRSRRAVEVAERYADGEATPEELDAAYDAAFDVAAALSEGADPGASRSAAWAASIAAHPQYTGEAVALEAAQAAGTKDEWTAQANLLRCLFGNPFRPAAIAPALLSWRDGTIRRLARALYDGCRFGDLPVLADALEDAGCDGEEVLRHCRSRGNHVRGCWVFDLILGRG
jgi:hypothetical protein